MCIKLFIEHSGSCYARRYFICTLKVLMACYPIYTSKSSRCIKTSHTVHTINDTAIIRSTDCLTILASYTCSNVHRSNCNIRLTTTPQGITRSLQCLPRILQQISGISESHTRFHMRLLCVAFLAWLAFFSTSPMATWFIEVGNSR